jgi:hypothetical protein
MSTRVRGLSAIDLVAYNILVVLFVPSVERDGTTAVNQTHWVDAALDMFGRVFGGAREQDPSRP